MSSPPGGFCHIRREPQLVTATLLLVSRVLRQPAQRVTRIFRSAAVPPHPKSRDGENTVAAATPPVSGFVLEIPIKEAK